MAGNRRDLSDRKMGIALVGTRTVLQMKLDGTQVQADSDLFLNIVLPCEKETPAILRDKQYKKTQMHSTVSFPRSTRCMRNLPARSTNRGSGGT